MITIGIDQSINSTGVAVNDNGRFMYYIIAGHLTKKMEKFSHEYVHIINYHKETGKHDNYIDNERQKTNNIYNICNKIEQLIIKYNPDEIHMEGISYGSVGSAALADLAGLNFSIRMMVRRLGKDIQIVSPMSVKKFAIANGKADKATMVKAWKIIDKNISDITGIKIDDLADAFFIAQYHE